MSLGKERHRYRQRPSQGKLVYSGVRKSEISLQRSALICSSTNVRDKPAATRIQESPRRFIRSGTISAGKPGTNLQGKIIYRYIWSAVAYYALIVSARSRLLCTKSLRPRNGGPPRGDATEFCALAREETLVYCLPRLLVLHIYRTDSALISTLPQRF